MSVHQFRAPTPGASMLPKDQPGCSIINVHKSIDWFKGKITGKSHISWENLWFPVDVPLSQPIESTFLNHSDWSSLHLFKHQIVDLLQPIIAHPTRKTHPLKNHTRLGQKDLSGTSGQGRHILLNAVVVARAKTS